MKVILPGKILAPYIEAYYVSSRPERGNSSVHFPAITSSYIKFSRASAVVSGQATRPTIAETNPDGSVGLGVKLRAGALPALVGIPASELTDRVLPLEELLGNSANELIEQISAASSSSTRLQLFEKMFARFVQRHRAPMALLEQEAVTLLRELSTMQVSELAGRLGYSPRHLQRKLNDFAGLSPRLYKRIARFEKALEMIQRSWKQGKTNWSTIALACGYTDQAHFIRDFQRFAGQTPSAYLANLREN